MAKCPIPWYYSTERVGSILFEFVSLEAAVVVVQRKDSADPWAK